MTALLEKQGTLVKTRDGREYVYPAKRKKARRTKESYRCKKPGGRKIYKKNLALGRGKASPKRKPLKAVAVLLKEKSMSDYANDPIGYIETHFFVIETRRPIVLLDHEKELLTDLFLRGVKPNLALIGMPKKTGKSTLAAAIAQWFLCTKSMAEVYLLASTQAQSQLVCFDKLVKSVRMNSELRKVCKIKTERIDYGESFAMILAPNVSVAGINPSLVIGEELWSWTQPEHKRSWDELTNTPTREENLNLITSYAGYTEDENSVLWGLYKKGIDQAEGKEEKDPRFLFRWFGIELYEKIPWVKPTYLPQQKRRLRENSFLRLHANVWASGEEAFVDVVVIDACTNFDLQRGASFDGPVTVGIDIGLKHDTSAVVIVGMVDDETLATIDHRCFIPKEGRTLDLEKTVEAVMLAYDKKYDIRTAFYDPFQFARSAKTLENAGLPMQEYPQTVGNTVAMSETLAGLLNSQNLMLYEDSELREHLLNARAKETQRGWRIVKKRQAGKIDLSVGLAMASRAAQEKLLLGEDSYFTSQELN